MFNNDVRLRALKTLAEALSPIEQKKAILYFSAGMQRSGQDNQVELRSAINAAVRANVAIYPIDTRGLQAVVPGGDARQASGRGTGALLGARGPAAVRAARLVAGHADVARGRHRRTRLHGLERLRRGLRARAARHVGVLPARLQQHQQREGRPLPPHPGAVEARRLQRRGARRLLRGSRLHPHVTDRPRGPARRTDVCRGLRDGSSRCSSSGGWFRLAADRYYVPVALTVPGSAVPVANEHGSGFARRARDGARRTQLPRRTVPRNLEAARRAPARRSPASRSCISRA